MNMIAILMLMTGGAAALLAAVAANAPRERLLPVRVKRRQAPRDL